MKKQASCCPIRFGTGEVILALITSYLGAPASLAAPRCYVTLVPVYLPGGSAIRLLAFGPRVVPSESVLRKWIWMRNSFVVVPARIAVDDADVAERVELETAETEQGMREAPQEEPEGRWHG